MNYTYLNSKKSASGYISLYALDYLKHNLDIFIDHKILPRLSASWTVQIQKRNGSYFDYNSSKQMPYETVVLLNGKMIYRLKKLNVFVQGENLLNKRYHDIGSVLLPGIWFTGGIQYRFDFSSRP
jgi:iron complex outermembrane receptor protein